MIQGSRLIHVTIIFYSICLIITGSIYLPSIDNLHHEHPIFLGIYYNNDNGLPWNLNIMGIEDAWNKTLGSENVTVAIIDSGIVWNEDELPTSRQWINEPELLGIDGVDDDNNSFIDDYHGWDFADADNEPNKAYNGDPFWHGTSVAAIIGALHDGDIISGIAPSVKLMDLRVLDETGFGYTGNIYRAFNYAIDKNVNVINLSIYFIDQATEQDLWIDLFQRATDRNITIVGISGNDGKNPVLFPASSEAVIAVGSVDSYGIVDPSSNFGSSLELVAPGRAIPSIHVDGELYYEYGTSFAAPHVTGTIALMKSIRDDLDVDLLRETLHYAATDINEPGWDNSSGYGIINASKSLYAWKNFESMDFDFDGVSNQLELAIGTKINDTDSDGDGLPDRYEVDQGFDPLDPTDANYDFDRDGLTNIFEYINGSDPKDPNDPTTSITRSKSQYELILPSIAIALACIRRKNRTQELSNHLLRV